MQKSQKWLKNTQMWHCWSYYLMLSSILSLKLYVLDIVLGVILLLGGNSVISPELNIRLTPDHPVNSYLSVGNQGGKSERSICPGLILAARLSARAHIFQIAKLSKFEQFNNFSKNCRLFKKNLRP